MEKLAAWLVRLGRAVRRLVTSSYVLQLEADLAEARERAAKAELLREEALETLAYHMGTPIVRREKRQPPAPGPRRLRTPSEARAVFEEHAREQAAERQREKTLQ